MKIPKILFGTGKEVHRPVGRWMARVKRQGQWPELSDADFIDTEEFAPYGSNIYVQFDIDPSIGLETNFRVYSPSRYFKRTLGKPEIGRKEDRLFFDSLVESTWGLLCLLPTGSYIPTLETDPGRCLHFFERLHEDWELLLNERHLFEYVWFGKKTGTYFWNRAYTSLFPSLHEAGVPSDLFKKTNPKTADDYLVPRWIEEYIL
ncbi:MAG: hypothetical protein AAGN35_25555 [Bacteroidota bacterium]